MDRAGHPPVREEGDDPFDLPPAAEVDEIAEIAAARRPQRRFGDGMLAEAGHKLGRVGERRPVGDMNLMLHSRPPGLSSRLPEPLAQEPFRNRQ